MLVLVLLVLLVLLVTGIGEESLEVLEFSRGLALLILLVLLVTGIGGGVCGVLRGFRYFKKIRRVGLVIGGFRVFGEGIRIRVGWGAG